MLLEHISTQNYKDAAFEAKLHGFKMNAPIREQEWEPEEDARLTDLAKQRYEAMQAAAAEPKG